MKNFTTINNKPATIETNAANQTVTTIFNKRGVTRYFDGGKKEYYHLDCILPELFEIATRKRIVSKSEIKSLVYN